MLRVQFKLLQAVIAWLYYQILKLKFHFHMYLHGVTGAVDKHHKLSPTLSNLNVKLCT